MVTGPWGSGKTYFWKNVVVPALTDHIKVNEGLRIAYVSLYGIKRTEELRSAVLAQLHPGMHRVGTALGALASSAVKMFGAESVDSKGALEKLLERLTKGKELILCFDDLERCAIPAHRVLGHLNQFVEHLGAKVVILCNEDEMENRKSGKMYFKTKEKVIRITRKLSIAPVVVYRSFIEQFEKNEDYYKFLKTNDQLIRSILDRSEVKNLRSLKSSLLVLETAHDAIAKLAANDNELLQTTIRSFFPLTLDHCERRLEPEQVRQILTHGNAAFFGDFMNREKGKPAPYADFATRYDIGMLGGDFAISPALAELLIDGHLDENKLSVEIEQHRGQRTAGKLAVQALIGGWFELSDDELPNVLENG
jgi:hypothetical protein